jgi:hypothetical protein
VFKDSIIPTSKVIKLNPGVLNALSLQKRDVKQIRPIQSTLTYKSNTGFLSECINKFTKFSNGRNKTYTTIKERIMH